MPKQKITKEMILNEAFEIAKKDGIEQVLVKAIASKLNCSVQPIYSYYENMDTLKNEVILLARNYVQEFIATNIDKNDIFSSTGKSYVKIAEQQPHLFKLFVFQKRENIASLDDLYRMEANQNMANFLSLHLGISVDEAIALHLHMLIYTIGIGTILSVCTPGIKSSEAFDQQERAYKIFLSSLKQ